MSLLNFFQQGVSFLAETPVCEPHYSVSVSFLVDEAKTSGCRYKQANN